MTSTACPSLRRYNRSRVLPFKLVYHPGYDLQLGSHVFPSRKFRLLRERLIDEGFASPLDFDEPEPATDDQIRLVHDAGWVERLKHDTLRAAERIQLEIPWSPPTQRAFWLAAGGTLLTARNALRDGAAFNLGGGFHHAFPAHGEGFCALNDIAIAIRVLQSEGAIERAVVIDCDVHHGNGTAAIFAGDPNVATLSIHQLNNYPSVKPPSTVDIHLPDHTGDSDYLRLLSEALPTLFYQTNPSLAVYVAGADPYQGDQLGGLSLTIDGLKERDGFVFSAARQHRIPVAVVLAGGYARDVQDTITIHANTAKALSAILKDCSPFVHSFKTRT